MEKNHNDDKEPSERDKCMEKKSNGDSTGKKGQDEERTTMKDRVKSLRSNKYAIVILILCILVLIFFIITIALAVKLGSRLPVTTPYCDTSDCLAVASSLKGGLDESVDPCEDFWQYSCGKWTEKNSIPPSKGSYSVSDVVETDLFKKIRHLIDITPIETKNLHKAEVKLKTFYLSCVNMNYIESGESKLAQWIYDDFGSWDVFTEFTANFDKDKTMHTLHSKYGVSPFFKIDVVPHPQKVDNFIVQISQTELGLKDPLIYRRNIDDPVIVAYQTFISDLLRAFKESNPDVSQHVDVIYNFETRLARWFMSPKELSEVDGEIITIGDLSASTSSLKWLQLLQAYFPNVQFTESTEILIQNKKYLENMSSVFSTTDLKALNIYLIWTLVTEYTKFMSSKFRNVHQKFNEKLTGSTEQEQRWHWCLKKSNDLFGYAIGMLYTRKYFDESISKELTTLTNDVIDTMANDVPNARWMDGLTKETAQQKIKEVAKFIGYPPFVLSQDTLNDYYKPLRTNRDFFQNIKYSANFKRVMKENYLITGFHEARNYLKPQNSFPTYQLINNKLSVPFGVEDLPTFNENYPLSVKYGSVGTLIAQALMRGIDERGSRYDDFGSDKMWWTNTTIRKYGLLKKCLINYYNEFDVENVKVNGNVTVHNNIDDIVGVKLAYKTYLKANKDSEKPLPGFGDNKEQQFFISYAQSFCQNIRKSEVETLKGYGAYPPNKVRVTGALSLLPEFRKAFKCKHRNPQCKVW